MFSLSLLVTPEIEAAKVILDKPIDVLKPGEGIRHLPIDSATIEAMRGRLLAEYETAVLLEIGSEDLDHAATQADRAFLRMIIHEEFDRVRINGYEYDSGTPCPDLRPDQVLDSIPDGEGLWVVQMIGPPLPKWHETLKSAGHIINVLPENTFIVRGTCAGTEALREIDGFQHIEPYQPGFKIQTRLADAPGKVRAIVQFDTGQDLEDALSLLDGMVDRRLSRETRGPFKSLLVELTPEQALQLAQRPEVIWLESYVKPGFSDERHAMVVASQHDTDEPNTVTEGIRYQDWLEAKGFCGDPPIPGCCGEPPLPSCITYSTKVAIFDSGLDKNVCQVEVVDPYGGNPDIYNPITGECQWAVPPPSYPLRHDPHPDLDGRENLFFCIDLPDGQGGFRNGCFDTRQNHLWGDYDVFDFSDLAPNNDFPHGTAVASVIAGDPIGGTGLVDGKGYYHGTGVAPDAQIVTARLWDVGIGGFGAVPEFSPDDYARLMAKVYSAGARFANNSWNEYADRETSGPPNNEWPDWLHVTEYNTFSQKADSLVRDGDGGFNDSEKGMTVVFSAGNYLWQDNLPPDPNPNHHTVAPGNAKNIISVGASDGLELQSEGRGCCSQLIDGIHSCDDVVESDDISNILFLSSRGTGLGGSRFKPDLVAPGARIKAAWSTGDQTSNDGYICFGATSGATPFVTGAGVLIDAWMRSVYSFGPSPAMVKAMLVAHAADLGGESGIDRYTGVSLNHSPSHPQGWGRLELGAVFSPGVETDWFDEDHDASVHPDSRRFAGTVTKWIEDFEVDDPTSDVIIVMAFTDAPGTPGAASPWVNNLNLTVIDKNFSKNVGPPRYYGNKFLSGSWYSKRYLGDFPPYLSPINNVEVVRVPGADFVAGDFTIRVHAVTLAGKAVPGHDPLQSANQDFALYVVNASSIGGGSQP